MSSCLVAKFCLIYYSLISFYCWRYFMRGYERWQLIFVQRKCKSVVWKTARLIICIHIYFRYHVQAPRSWLKVEPMETSCACLAFTDPRLRSQALYSPADCVPRWRPGRACVFRWSLGLCGRANHVWHLQGEITDQAGQGGLRRALTVEVRFRDASAQQTSLCKRTSEGVTPEEDPTSLKKG